jgi:DNA adenine methylase
MNYINHLNQILKPKPFLKWVGGKTQLIKEIDQLITDQFSYDQNFTYIEPFIGGGAILFHVLTKFPQINGCIINDINPSLINTYQIIKEDYQMLINFLLEIQEKYYGLVSVEEKKEFYLEKRKEFNTSNQETSIVKKTALLIFLNKTCFNGLYRVNKKGQFNVPFGKYEKPKICDQDNIISVHHYLQKVKILQGDFAETLSYATNSTIFYLDPPYKPINVTSAFTSYAQDSFNDQDQIKLKLFCDQINEQGNYFILSNSDIKNFNQENNFFDELYQQYKIKRVKARRSINSKGDQRGEIFELLITNF